MKIVPAPLPDGNYFKEVVPKHNIVLHHTVSSTAKSALNWWAADPRRVATAFVIDKDGTIYQAFDPQYWAHHLGLTTSNNTMLNKSSIGIEIVNEGPLQDSPEGLRWNFAPGNKGLTYKPYKSLAGAQAKAAKWRGFEYWALYTPEQYQALNELIPMLLDQFKLEPTITANLEYNFLAPTQYTIYTHCNVRKDKSDLSPAFDFNRLTFIKPAS